MTAYNVHAKRWEHGWELHIDGVGVTQSHSLSSAETMARSYIAMVTGAAIDSFSIDIIPEIGPALDEAVRAAREAARQANEAVAAAAASSRDVVRKLRDSGLTSRDISVALKVTPQRVSQLIANPRGRARA
jgi:hypothetical protein